MKLSEEINELTLSKLEVDFKYPHGMAALGCEHQYRYTSATGAGTAVLVGLHACGDLSVGTLNLFASNPSIHGVCLISCCYHKMKQFPVSKTYQKCCAEINITTEHENQSSSKDYSCITSTHALRLASQEPFSRYVF